MHAKIICYYRICDVKINISGSVDFRRKKYRTYREVIKNTSAPPDKLGDFTSLPDVIKFNGVMGISSLIYKYNLQVMYLVAYKI